MKFPRFCLNGRIYEYIIRDDEIVGRRQVGTLEDGLFTDKRNNLRLQELQRIYTEKS